MDEVRKSASNAASNERAGLISNETGSVAIEFAVVAPILIILIFGVVEATNMLAQDRKVALANQTMVDLIARLDNVTNQDQTTASQAVNLMLTPYNADYTATIAILQFDKTGKPDFSNSNSSQFPVHGTNPFSQSEMTTDTTGLSVGSDAVVIGKITSTYEPILFPNFMNTSFSLSALNVQRPRQGKINSSISP